MGGSVFDDHFAGGGSLFMRKVGPIYVIKNNRSSDESWYPPISFVSTDPNNQLGYQTPFLHSLQNTTSLLAICSVLLVTFPLLYHCGYFVHPFVRAAWIASTVVARLIWHEDRAL